MFEGEARCFDSEHQMLTELAEDHESFRVRPGPMPCMHMHGPTVELLVVLLLLWGSACSPVLDIASKQLSTSFVPMKPPLTLLHSVCIGESSCRGAGLGFRTCLLRSNL